MGYLSKLISFFSIDFEIDVFFGEEAELWNTDERKLTTKIVLPSYFFTILIDSTNKRDNTG